MTLLHEDGLVLAVDKPAGLAVIPERHGDASCLRHELEAARGEPLWVVHRLDRDTSGVVLFARTAEAHRAMNGAFEHREVDKRYHCLTLGAPREPVATVGLHEGRKGRMRPARPDEPGTLEAETGFRVLQSWQAPRGCVSWVEAAPKTGRRHQIRVHARAVGAPLLLDPLYASAEPIRARDCHEDGDATVICDRLTLHALRIALPHPSGHGVLEVTAPLAPDLAAVLALLGT